MKSLRIALLSSRIVLIVLLGQLVARTQSQEPSLATAASPAKVSFSEHIRPIFVKHCVGCHGGVKQASGLSFIYRDTAIEPAESGLAAIVPGKPDESHLLERVRSDDESMRMPPAEHGPALSETDIELLTKWIEQGAEWELHWSFIPPVERSRPSVVNATWPKEELDYYVLARMETAGLTPAPEASRAEWLRRCSLDLTGLPPSEESYAALEKDTADGAHERAVDRLLASQTFGERWASVWLDLARYADTQGFESDRGRDAWPYRDWVIRAFNDDMPYDLFTIRQLAGDLLPNATLPDRVATGFHRNTQTNSEGGTDDEEYRMAAVLDRTATTWQVWQGLTFKCTQCHSHPYDPIAHDEYYRFVAFLNTTADQDLDQDQPLLAVPNNPADWSRAESIDNELSELNRRFRDRMLSVAQADSQWRPLQPTHAYAAGETSLRIATVSPDAPRELLAEGTISTNEAFVALLTAPQGMKEIAALRVEALPVDPVSAQRIPEAGFVLSHLQLELVDDVGRHVQTIALNSVISDEERPLFDPYDSLNGNANGWGEYTRMHQGHWAVFGLEKPVAIPKDYRLRLSMQFNRSGSGDSPLVIRRARFSASDNPEWVSDTHRTEVETARANIKRLLKEREAVDSTHTPVLVEQSKTTKRQTFNFVRGNWLERKDPMSPGIPAVFTSFPQNANPDRLAMARWIASNDNPLTSRVMVNRLWQELFGLGIVETVDDFGASGSKPTNLELLDHLALRFQNAHGWSVKKMLRELVLSAAYRQMNRLDAAKVAVDPTNVYLSRGPRTRLSAEMVRDQALLLSGRLSSKMFGPPVMPPQPDGVWRSVYSDAKWSLSEGEDRYRRAVYTYCKRTSGYPAMLTFDMPSRDVCVGRRQATNTPLQALVTLNDEAFTELAKGFAEKMRSRATRPYDQLAAGYHMATGRDAGSDRLERLLALYMESLAAYDVHPEQAKRLCENRDLYALAITASVMFNLDDLLTK